MATFEATPEHTLFAERDDPGGLRLDALAALLESGLSVEIVARGRSMEPIIPDGTRLTLAPTLPAALRVGDVVALRYASTVRIHRLVAIRPADGPAFIARGDSSSMVDPVRYAPDLLGRVISIQTTEGRTHNLRRTAWKVLNVLLAHVSRHQLWTIGRWPHGLSDVPFFADKPRPDAPARNGFFKFVRFWYRRFVWWIFLSLAWSGVRWL